MDLGEVSGLDAKGSVLGQTPIPLEADLQELGDRHECGSARR